MKTFRTSSPVLFLLLAMLLMVGYSQPLQSATTCGNFAIEITSPQELAGVVGNTVPVSGYVTVPSGDVEEVELVFVIDVSGSMLSNNLYLRQNEIVRLIAQDLGSGGSTRMGLVWFSSFGNVLEELTNSSGTITGSLPTVNDIGGGTNIADGLRLGFEVLSRGSSSARKIVFLLTDGEDSNPDAVRELARNAPYVIHTDFLGGGSGAQLMKDIADLTGGRFFPDADPAIIAEFFRGVIVPLKLERIEVTSSKDPLFKYIIPQDQVTLGRWFVPGVPVTTSCSDSTIITARAYLETGLCVPEDAVTVAREQGRFEVAPTAISRSIQQGESVLPVDVTFRNLERRATSFNVRKEDPAPWFSVSTSGGTAIESAKFTVTLNTPALPAGTYTSAVLISNNASCQVTFRLPITISVAGSDLDGRLEVPISLIDRRIVTGRVDTFSNMPIRNVGHGQLGVSITDTAAWLTNDLESTRLAPDEEVLVDLTFDTRGLAVGKYTALMDVSPSKGSARTINVGMEVVSAGAEFPAEEFSNDFDLQNRQIDYTRDGASYRYCLQTVTTLPVDEATHSALTFGNNESRRIALTGGAKVPFFGVNYDAVYISSNGNLTFSQADSSATTTAANHFATPRLSVLFADLNPASTGRISYRQLTDRFVVTWRGVPFSSTTAGTGLATAQAQLFFDGRISTTVLTAAAKRAVVGVSAGTMPTGFAEVNFAGVTGCPPTQVVPTLIASTISAINLSAPAGTSIGTQAFTIRNGGTVDADFTASEVVPWMAINPTVGRLTPSGAVITVDLQTGSLPVGVYESSIRVNVPSNPLVASLVVPVRLEITPKVVSNSGAIAVVTTGSTLVANGSLTPIAFGTTEVGFAPLARGFVLLNQGANPLITSGLTVPPGYAILDGLAPSIAGNTSDAFSIVLQTTAPGTPEGAVSFVTNDSLNPTISFLIEGEVLPEAVPDLALYDGVQIIPSNPPGGFDLGAYTLASGFANKDLLVRNVGRAPLTLTSLSLTGDFTTPTIAPTSLASGSEFTLRLRVPTSTLGSYAGSLVIASSDPTEPIYTVPLRAAVVVGDVYEENDTLDSVLTAPSLPLNQDIRNLVMDDLADWYRVVPPTCANLRVTLSHEADRGDLNMEIYTAECLSVGVPNKLGSSYLLTNTEAITLVNSGLNDFFIRVYGEGSALNPQYDLRIDTFSVDDPYEPNDAPFGAGLPQLLRNNLYENLVLKNEDTFRVPVVPGSTIGVRVEHNFQLGQIYMQIFPDDGTGYANTLASNYVPNNNIVEVPALAVGSRSSVLVRVYPSAVGNTNFYSLVVTDGAAPVQVAELEAPDAAPELALPAPSTIFEATPLALNTTVPGLSIGGGERWYRMALPTCTNVRVTMDFTHAAGDLNMQLYTASCLSVAGARMLGSSYSQTNQERVVFLNNGLSECYLRVYGEGGVGNPNFSLRADTLGVDDTMEPNDGPLGDGPRTISTNTTYNDLVLKNDDFFRVAVTPGRTISVRADHDFQLGQLYIQVIADDGSGFAGILGGYYVPNQNVIEVPNFAVGTATSLLVRVYPAGVGNTNVYSLRVTQN